jgi:hypothetical protein
MVSRYSFHGKAGGDMLGNPEEKRPLGRLRRSWKGKKWILEQ